MHPLHLSEEKAFTWLFKSYYKKLCYYIRDIVPGRDEAEDCVSGVFERFHVKKVLQNTKAENEHQLQKQVASWLYTSAFNAAITIKNNHAKRRFVDYTILEETLAEDPKETEPHPAIKEIENLPPSCAMIIKMLFLEEIPVRQIAKTLNIQITTVKAQKQKGLERLRKAFHYSKQQYEAANKKLLQKIANSDKPPHQLHKLYGFSFDKLLDIKNSVRTI